MALTQLSFEDSLAQEVLIFVSTMCTTGFCQPGLVVGTGNLDLNQQVSFLITKCYFLVIF